MASLFDLLVGSTAKVVGYQKLADKSYRQKLLSMGLTPHTEFTVIRRAPLGDPIEIKVRDSFLSLRQREAVIILIEEIQ